MKFKKLLSTMLALVCFISAAGMGFVGEFEAIGAYRVEYRSRPVGWQNVLVYISEPGASGLYGGDGIDLFALRFIGMPAGLSAYYMVHSNAAGWSGRHADGSLAGVAGQPINAFSIAISGLSGWSIFYKVHIKGVGWTEWAADGDVVGTPGSGRIIDAARLKCGKIQKQIQLSEHAP